jgi:hypothetical protein
MFNVYSSVEVSIHTQEHAYAYIRITRSLALSSNIITRVGGCRCRAKTIHMVWSLLYTRTTSILPKHHYRYINTVQKTRLGNIRLKVYQVLIAIPNYYVKNCIIYLSCSRRIGVRYSATLSVSTATPKVAIPSAGAPSTVCLATRSLTVM